MTRDFTEDDIAALLRELDRIIADDRYFFSALGAEPIYADLARFIPEYSGTRRGPPMAEGGGLVTPRVYPSRVDSDVDSPSGAGDRRGDSPAESPVSAGLYYVAARAKT